MIVNPVPRITIFAILYYYYNITYDLYKYHHPCRSYICTRSIPHPKYSRVAGPPTIRAASLFGIIEEPLVR